MVTAGSAIAGGIESESRIAAIARQRVQERQREALALSEWVKHNKAESDNARQAQYRQSVKDSLSAVDQSQFTILRDPRSENNEWVMNEAVMRQNNAQLPEEKSAWNDFIIRYQSASRQDVAHQAALASRVANSKLVSDTRIAGKTAKNAIDDMWNDIQLDGDLQQKLIGDGKGINDRVNEHVLQVAMAAAPQLFNIRKGDPMFGEKMEQQTLLLDQLENRAQQTIVQPLTNQFISNTSKAMEAAGGERIDVSAQAFAEGNMTASEYHDVVGDTLRTQFAHVDPKQRDNIREKLYRQQFDRLSQLLDQPDPGKTLERMESLMNVADLNVHEKQVIREQIIGEKFPKAVTERLKQTFENKMAEMSGITRLNDGRTIVPRDMRTIQVEMLENGNYRDIAGQMLDELGIKGDPGTLTPLQANLLGEITKATMDAEQKALAGQAKATASVDRAARFLSGSALSSEETTKQWEEGGLMRLFSGKMSPDDPVMQGVMQAYRSKTGKDLDWKGEGPIPLNADTLPVLRDVALQEGRAWGRNSLVSVPHALSNTIENMVLYEAPERAEVALNFWQGLGVEGQDRVGSTLSARAQMVMMEGQRLYNQDPVARGLSMAEITNRVRTIDQNTATAALRLAKDQAGLHDLTPDPQFHYDYAKALSTALGRDVLKDEYGLQVKGFDLATPWFDGAGTKALATLGGELGGKNALIPLFAQMAVVQQGNPGIALDQAAIVVASRMREQGYKIVSGGVGPQLVKDQWNHYPTDTTPGVLIQQALSQPLSKDQAQQFIARLPQVGPQTMAMARDGILPGDILWSHMSEQAGPGATLPHPSNWAFVPETQGSLFEGMMTQENGGIPMQIKIPGVGKTQMMLDANGNPLLLASSKRRSQAPVPVDRTGIPDYFLTPAARAKRVKLKPDSAQRMEAVIRETDQYHSRPSLGSQNLAE